MSRGTAAMMIGAMLAVSAIAVLWWFAVGSQAVRPVDQQADQQPDTVREPHAESPAPAKGSIAPATKSPLTIDPQLPRNRTLLLPDGTRVPALNGAVNASPMKDAWPSNVPWSPIVATERSDLGVDWYVHQDGSRSTTEMKWRSDLGREDAVTRLARPAPTPPKVVPPNIVPPKTVPPK